MKKHEIKVGGHYLAKVSGKITTVRVDRISTYVGINEKNKQHYHVTNLATGRKTTFRSAAKFRSEVNEHLRCQDRRIAKHGLCSNCDGTGRCPRCFGTGEAEQRPDPTLAESAETRKDGQPAGVQSPPTNVEGSSICPRCGQTVAVVDGSYDHHRKPHKSLPLGPGVTCWMSGKKVACVKAGNP